MIVHSTNITFLFWEGLPSSVHNITVRGWQVSTWQSLIPIFIPSVPPITLDKDACGSSASAWTLASFLGRVAYNYASRYLLTVNFRADGSSRFAPDIVGVLSLLFLQVGEFQAKSSCNLYKTLLPT